MPCVPTSTNILTTRTAGESVMPLWKNGAKRRKKRKQMSRNNGGPGIRKIRKTSGAGNGSRMQSNSECSGNRIITVTRLKLKGSDFTVYAQADKALKIEKAVLKYRNIVRPTEYPLKYELLPKERHFPGRQQASGGQLLQIRIWGSTGNMTLSEGDWDVYVYTEDGEALPVILDGGTRLKLLFGNYEIPKGDHILFPMASTNHMLTFRYRLRSDYDSGITSAKQNMVYVFYRLTKPIWTREKIWVIYEKYCTEAQDNGCYFFQYCMENLPEEEKKYIYYILDRNSAQWDRMQKYGSNVVPFMSARHILYLLAARIYAAPDAKFHGFVWKPKPNIISREISKKQILFLQHGVTALKRVDKLFGKNGSAPMTYFAVTSEFEQKIVTENFGYAKENVPILGFTRWDVLENKARPDEKNILIMPTWRPWLEEQSDEVFRESEYCRRYRQLLENPELGAFLRENNVKIIFHIHPKMKEFLEAFQTENDQVKLIVQGSQPLNELIMKCSMLITDYSSVSWDVHYLAKPVLFYQFDYDLYQQANGSYIDMTRDLFGDRCLDQECLVKNIKEYIENNFKEKERYAQMRKEHFAYTDHNNSRRTLEFLKSRGC
ncbi:MAG TPA: hypothetical protein DHW25_01065 [Blautia sp.]|nr:hypothetical protein [Blautia sp.]